MKADEPPLAAEHSISCEKDIVAASSAMELALEVLKGCQDEIPQVPSRLMSSNKDMATADTSEAESITDSHLASLTPEGPEADGVDHSTVCSDITDPTAFASMDASYLNNLNNQYCSSESSFPQQSLYVDEEDGESDNFEPLVTKPASTTTSTMDRAVFQSAKKDMPPQVAIRYHSSIDWTTDDSQRMDDRFGGMVPDNSHQDIPITLPKPSYSKQEPSIPAAPSGLQKLAEAFMSGCALATHTHHLKKYPNTFVGSQAVDFMLTANLASTREDAVFLGRRFCKELNLFHHVRWDHTFKDGQFFYRFNAENSKDVRCATPFSRGELLLSTQKFIDGMPVSKYKSRRFKTYRNSFSGKQAVDYILQAKLASNRPDAVFLGQRMMEELEVLEPVAHNSRFKDSFYLYRFVGAGNGNSSLLDESAASGALSESFGAQHHQYKSRNPLKPAADGRGQKQVTFGKVQSRHFERRLDCNPATTSGPSLGLGWTFYDDVPIPLGDEQSGALRSRGGRLSSEDRKRILTEWGYNKGDINRATKLNETIREKRKRSLNNDSANVALLS